jgi:isopentenyl diphosphate isomerase/L-lactate dehydrogenase-like FMN-dependent dehydrogenase
LRELRTALFLTGASSLAALWTTPRVVTGATRAWIDQLGAA